MIPKRALKNVLRGFLGERRYNRMVRALRPRRTFDRYGAREIVGDVESGAAVIREALRSGRPAAIGKIGATEMRACREAAEIISKRREEPSSSLLYELHLNAGVFPPTTDTVTRFASVYESIVRDVDVLVAWFIDGEQEFVDRHAPEARLIRMLALESYLAPDPPWTALLAGKRVVVVSPFDRSVETQYARRDRVWSSCPAVLPSFQLRTVRAPFSDRLVKSSFPDWFAAFEDLKRQLASAPFDIALVGASAFSLPLAVEAKRLGGVGIHLGGALQLLFGILGGRWEESDVLSRFVNESWVRPRDDERPPDFKKIEGGCYW